MMAFLDLEVTRQPMSLTGFIWPVSISVLTAQARSSLDFKSLPAIKLYFLIISSYA